MKKSKLIALASVSAMIFAAPVFASNDFFNWFPQQKSDDVSVVVDNDADVDNHSMVKVNTGGNEANGNGLDGMVVTGDAIAESDVKNMLNKNDIEVNLSSVIEMLKGAAKVSVKAINNADVDNDGFFMADTGNNEANGNGGDMIEESFFKDANSTMSSSQAQNSSTYNAASEQQSKEMCHFCFSQESQSTLLNKTEAASQAMMEATNSLTVAKTKTVTPMGSGTIMTGNGGASNKITTLLNSTLVKIVK